MSRFLLLVVLAAFLLIDVRGEDDSEWTQCSTDCVCSETSENLTAAICSFPVLLDGRCNKSLLDIPEHTIDVLYLPENNLTQVPVCLFVKTTNLTALDLSENKIQALPDGAFEHLNHLQKLNLAYNELQVIEDKSFIGLEQLIHLDLSHNKLRTWRGDTSLQLPSLLSLDLTGNAFKVSDDRLLHFPSLVWLNGLIWSNECKECLLLRTTAFKEDEICEFTLEDYTFFDEVGYGLSLSFVKLGFSPQCLCDDDKEGCAYLELYEPYDRELNTFPRQLFYAEYFFGSVAIVTNLVVVVTISLSSRLRKTPSFLAVGSISLCDTIMGIYSILIARYTVYEFIVNEEKYPGMDVFVNNYCTFMGVLFTTAQITAVLSSFLVTLERYLAIVYCMNPSIRIRRKTSIACLLSFWLVAVAYSILPVFRVGGFRYHGEFTCMMFFVNSEDHLDSSVLALTVAVFLVLLYITSLLLYIPIFRYVKNAGDNAGIKRKAAFAKKMAVMVVTNFLFFIFPMTATLLFVYLYEELMDVFKVDTLAELQNYFIVLSWLPVMCLTINSCLNPFLCAFRHPRFKEELRSLVEKCKNACRPSRESSNDHELPITHTLDNLTLASENHGIQLHSYRTQQTSTGR